MNKQEFLEKSEQRLRKIEHDFLYNNYAKQLLAYKLGADISKSYKLEYLWKKVLVVISSSCFILNEDLGSKLALKSLYKVANVLENIAEVKNSAEEYDVEFFMLLSALCYDVSGYQANAYCMVKKIEQYQIYANEDCDVSEENFILRLILNALQKKLPLMRQMILEKERDEITSEPFHVLLKAFKMWVKQILDLEEKNFVSLFEKAHILYLKSGNIYISQLILLFIVKMKMFLIRSINLKIKNAVGENDTWNKYIKLLANDYFQAYNKLKNENEKKSVFEFWTSQIRAIDDGLLTNDCSFVVQMPTSAGKTFVAELYILKHLVNTQKKVLYISPFRALASEKVSEIGKYFSYLGYKVSLSTANYEYEPIFDSVSSDSDVLIFTPEKTDAVFRMMPEFFASISAIVVDEGHIVGNLDYRAALTEMLLIKMKMRYPEINILFISAVMPPMNAGEYAQWLSNCKDNVLRSKLFSDSKNQEEWEPSRKNIGCFCWKKNLDGYNGEIQFENIKTDDEKNGGERNAFVPYFLRGNEYGINSANKKPETAAALGIKLSATGNTLIFCGKVKSIVSVAKRIIKAIKGAKLPIEGIAPDENKESFYYSKFWFGEKHWVTEAIRYGIGIHYGDMPEQVRSAVEKDCKNQKLRIILCTNTIGQGINFPIKNIVFYDIAVGYDKDRERQTLILHRDFWNIVGRAGRAEKETEGNIIFLINTDVDERIYRAFIDKEKIEKSQSIISYALQEILKKRISETTLDRLIFQILENFFLDLVTEEVFENDSEFIDNIISNSLFHIQSDEKEIKIIRNSFHNAILTIKKRDENVETLEMFAKTGLNFDDNKTIVDFINENSFLLDCCLENPDIEKFVDMFLLLISTKDLSPLKDYSLSKIVKEKASWKRYKAVICAWVNNESVEKIETIWSETLGLNFDNFYILLAKGLCYLFPWLMNAVIILTAYELKKDYASINEYVRCIPTFVKYGLNDKNACVARERGIKNRETAIFLSKRSGKSSAKEFVSWLVNLRKKEIDEMPLSFYEKENIENVIFESAPNSNRNLSGHFIFSIVGTKYEKKWKRTSLSVMFEDSLCLHREKENKYDPFAIRVTKGEEPLGYVPREFAKYIATEMDLNNSHYMVNVKNVEYVSRENYNRIMVEIGLL